MRMYGSWDRYRALAQERGVGWMCSRSCKCSGRWLLGGIAQRILTLIVAKPIRRSEPSEVEWDEPSLSTEKDTKEQACKPLFR